MRMYLSLRRCEPGAPHPPTIATFGRGKELHGESHAHDTASRRVGAASSPEESSPPPLLPMASKTPRAYSGDARVGTPRTACSLSSSSVRASGTSLHRHDGDTPCTNRSGRPQLSKSSRIGCSASSPRVWSMTLSLARGGSGVSGVASIVSLGLFTSFWLVSSVVGMRARAGYPRATTRVMMVCTRKSWFRLGDKINVPPAMRERAHESTSTSTRHLLKLNPAGHGNTLREQTR